MNLREMLDLPKTERSRYLAKMPLTRTYVLGCVETNTIRFFRRTIVRHGGTYRECYRVPGVFWVATFRSHKQMNACTRALIAHLNLDLRRSNELHGHISEEELSDLLYTEEFGQNFGDVPALEFEIDSWITEDRRIRRGFHPVTADQLN